MRIKRFLFSAAALVMMIPAVAQTVWHNPLTEGDEPFVQGRAWNAEIGQNYHRFPDRAKDMVRPAVWSLSLCSSGLFVDFFTNAEDIVIRYNVKNGKNADNIPKFAKSGIDIYRIDKDGVQHWVNLDFQQAEPQRCQERRRVPDLSSDVQRGREPGDRSPRRKGLPLRPQQK